MSKVDVENIKRDTAEEGVNSYLGRSCYFRGDNKYICDFVRPSNNGNGSSNFFTKITVND